MSKPNAEAAALVGALCNVSPFILENAEAHAWQEHEAGRLNDTMYFVVVRRLRMLGRPPENDAKTSTST